MKLLSFLKPSRKDTKPSSFFLALQLGTHTSKAAIWREKGEEIEIQQTLKGNTPEHVIQKAKESYPIASVVFGLPDTYVDGEKIREDKLPRLKQLAQSFSLSPLGFVVVPEAIAHFIGSEDSTPQTAILLGVEDTSLTLSLFRVGVCAKNIHVARTESLITDLEKGIAEFSEEEILPSKIIVYGDDDSLEPLKEQLLAYPWHTNDKFLHVPKIEVLPWEYSIEAVVHAGVSEMKGEGVPDALSSNEPAQETPPPVVVTREETVEPEETVIKTSAASLGFASDTSKFIEPEIAVNKPTDTAQPSRSPYASTPRPVIHENDTTPQPKTHLSMPSLSLPSLPKFSIPSLPALPSPHGLLPAVAVAGLVVAALVGAVFTYPQATVTLLAEPKVSEDEVTLTLNTSISDIDIESGEIPGKVYSITVSESQNGDTTGKKIIGEKASGTIALINKSTSEKSFTKGTVLGTSSISFVLEEDVKVASASDTGESLNYGKGTAKVVASKIGPNGNIDNDVELEISNVSKSSAVAKSQEKFSGGTEREIKVVSKADQEALLAKATEALKEKAREQLTGQISASEKFLEESLTENIVEKKYNAEIGEETDKLTVDLVLEISQTGYNVDDINRFLESYMAEKIEDGFKLDTEKSFFRVIDTKEDDDGNVEFTANYHAVLLPEVTLDNFSKQLSGASTKKLENLVGELTDQNIVGYEITNTRSLPFLGSRLPFMKKNITVEVKMYE